MYMYMYVYVYMYMRIYIYILCWFISNYIQLTLVARFLFQLISW